MRVYKSDPPPLGSVGAAGRNDIRTHPPRFGLEFFAVEEENSLTSSSELSARGKGQKWKNDDRR